MKLLRLISLSLKFFLCDKLYRNTVGETATTTDNKVYKGTNNSWVVSQPIAVYRNSVPVPSVEYIVDYRNGFVSFGIPNDATDTITLYYSYNWADIVNAWPDEVLSKPVISIASGPSREYGLELGGGNWIVTKFYINVFATNEASRDDIAQEIRELLDGTIPLIDFNIGFPINSDGTRNEVFDITAQTEGRLICENIVITPNPTGTEEDKGRALIDFNLVTIRV